MIKNYICDNRFYLQLVHHLREVPEPQLVPFFSEYKCINKHIELRQVISVFFYIVDTQMILKIIEW